MMGYGLYKKMNILINNQMGNNSIQRGREREHNQQKHTNVFKKQDERPRDQTRITLLV